MAKKKQSEPIAIKSTMVLRPRKLIADREEKVQGKGNKTVGSGMTKKTIRSPKPEKNINATGSTMVLRPRKQTEEKIEVKGKKTVGSGMTRIVDSGIGKIGRKRKVMAYESNSKTAENVVKRVKAMNKNIKETSPTVRRPKPEKTIHTTGSTMVLRPRTPKAKVEMPVKKNEKTKGKMSVEVNKKVGGKKKTVATGKIKIGNAVKIGTYAKRKLAADKGDIKVGRSITHKNNQLVKRKKTDNVVTKSIFPAEIIMEILSWLPVKFFGTPMIVCKQWYALIQDRHFIEKQMSRNFSYTESRVRQGYKKVCSCQGLRLERNTSTKRYCIRNPNTKQFLELPDPPTGKFDIIFRYVPPTCNYKIVLIYDKNNIRCCDLSVGNDELSWRLLKMPTRDNLKRNIKIFSTNLFREVVHCVRVFASGDEMFEEVVSLDLGTEQFTITKLPEGQYKNWENVWIINYKGKLALVDIIGDQLCVLVLENYKKQKWGKKEPLVSLELMKKLEVEHGTMVPYSVDTFETLWFWVKDARKYISYNTKTKYICSKQYIYAQSLVRLRGMQPE